GVSGDVCNASAVLKADGMVAGLDLVAAPARTIAGQVVTACVGADFGSKVQTSVVRLRLGASPKACDGACGPGYCGTGDEALVFHGSAPDGSDLGFAEKVSLIGEVLLDYDVHVNGALRYAVVCRGSGGALRDDIAVDAIS